MGGHSHFNSFRVFLAILNSVTGEESPPFERELKMISLVPCERSGTSLRVWAPCRLEGDHRRASREDVLERLARGSTLEGAPKSFMKVTSKVPVLTTSKGKTMVLTPGPG